MNREQISALSFVAAALMCGLVGCITIPDDWFHKPKPDGTTTTTTTTSTTQPPVIGPPVNEGDTDLSGYDVQGGFDFRHAKTVLQTVKASIGPLGGDGGPFALVTLDKPTPWSTVDGYCNAVVVGVWKDEAGRNTGGYFDYVANGTLSHGWRLSHLIDGYGGPASGQPIGFFIMAQDGSERSSVGWTVMP